MLLMLPKAKSPVVWDPTFPRNGVSMPGSANHSFCPPPVARTISEWNKGFDDWWKNCTAVVPASQDCSAPCGYPFLNQLDLLFQTISPFSSDFWQNYIPKQWCFLQDRNPSFSCTPCGPLQSARSCFTLLQAAHTFGQHCCWEGEDGKGGKKILLDLQMIFWSSKVSFLVSWQGLYLFIKVKADNLAVQHSSRRQQRVFSSVQAKHTG